MATLVAIVALAILIGAILGVSLVAGMRSC